jgi:hypothetical protein
MTDNLLCFADDAILSVPLFQPLAGIAVMSGRARD